MELNMFVRIAVLAVNVGLLCGSRIFKAVLKSEHNGRVEYSGAIDISETDSLVRCTGHCFVQLKCVSFFFNKETQLCVMHSKHFYPTFKPPRTAGSGWRYYLVQDVSGSCPPDYVYYRHLDFCYHMAQTAPINFPYIKTKCSGVGGQLAAVNSPEKQEYYTHFLDGRPLTSVCIAGERKRDGAWVLDDGTPLTYFNWYPGHPKSNSQTCIVFKYTNLMGNAWFDSACAFSESCIYICEI